MEKFIQRKNSVLSKLDKSSKGDWDKRIVNLCNKINSSEEYYTTSSCAGRGVLILDEDKKRKGLFVKVYHDEISFEQLKEDLILSLKENKQIKFKLEPCILHVACKDLVVAQKLFDKAKLVGWKRSGIISMTNNIILELNSTEKLEFPIISSNKILVDDNFLKIIVKEANKKLKKSWKKIDELERIMEL